MCVPYLKTYLPHCTTVYLHMEEILCEILSIAYVFVCASVVYNTFIRYTYVSGDCTIYEVPTRMSYQQSSTDIRFSNPRRSRVGIVVCVRGAKNHSRWLVLRHSWCKTRRKLMKISSPLSVSGQRDGTNASPVH